MTSIAPDVNYQIKFTNDFILLSQQGDSRLRSTVRTDPDAVDGKFAYFDRIGAIASVKKKARAEDTGSVQAQHSRRKVFRTPFKLPQLVDRTDVRNLGGALRDPSNRYIQNAIKAMRRDMDQVIIDAALGNSYAVDEGDVSTAVALPSAQVIVNASAGLTIAKLQKAKELLDHAEVDEMVPRYIVVTSKQINDLLGTTQATSSDYNTVKTLVEGKIDTFYGFKFIRSELLPVSSSIRQCIAYAGTGIGYAGDDSPFVDIGPRRDKSMAKQIYMEWEIGATRVEEVQVVEIDCLET